MTLEILLLALATAVRPTSLAATYALLASGAPRRLMTAYVAAGLAFTILFGLVVVLAVGGIDIGAGSSRTTSEADIAGGAIALVLALLVHRGQVLRARPAGDLPRHPGRWDRLLEERLTMRTALLAGPATHLPGIFYLLALNVIVSHQPVRAAALLEVLLYNAVWFAIPLAALVVCIVDPQVARDVVGAISVWVRRNRHAIAVAGLTLAGVVLLARGLAGALA